MYFAKFTLNEELVRLIEAKDLNEIDKLQKLNESYGEKICPSYVMSFIQINPYPGHIVIHAIRRVGPDTEYHDTLYRPKGIMGGQDYIDKFPNAVHHFMVIANTRNEARIMYRYKGKVQFLKNLKKEAVLNV